MPRIEGEYLHQGIVLFRKVRPQCDVHLYTLVWPQRHAFWTEDKGNLVSHSLKIVVIFWGIFRDSLPTSTLELMFSPTTLI
jgi:hypothetical protein